MTNLERTKTEFPTKIRDIIFRHNQQRLASGPEADTDIINSLTSELRNYFQELNQMGMFQFCGGHNFRIKEELEPYIVTKEFMQLLPVVFDLIVFKEDIFFKANGYNIYYKDDRLYREVFYYFEEKYHPERHPVPNFYWYIDDKAGYVPNYVTQMGE